MQVTKLLLVALLASSFVTAAEGKASREKSKVTLNQSNECELTVENVSGSYLSKLSVGASPDTGAEGIGATILVLNSDQTAQLLDADAIKDGQQITPSTGAWRIQDGVVQVVVYDFFHFETGDQATQGWDEYDRISLELSNFEFDCNCEKVVTADFRRRLEGVAKFARCGNVCTAEQDPQDFDVCTTVTAFGKGTFKRIQVLDFLFPIPDCIEEGCP